MEAVPVALGEHILEHLANPEGLARKFLDVSEIEYRGTGLDAYDSSSPAEGDGALRTDDNDSTLLQLMTAALPKGDWRTKLTLSSSLTGIAQRLMLMISKFYWKRS